MAEKIKEYTNGEITVVWKSQACIHSGVCLKALPNVFNLKQKPWVNMEADSTDKIIDVVKKCPSGALSYYKNKEGKTGITFGEDVTIKVLNGGPLLINGKIKLIHDENEIETGEVTALCRCGASKSKPFCDGKHLLVKFEKE